MCGICRDGIKRQSQRMKNNGEYSFSEAGKTSRNFHTFLCLCCGVCKRVGRSKEKIGLRKFKKGPRNFKICPTFFLPLQTRMDKAFPKTRSVQQKSPLSLSAFSRPVSPPQNSAPAYLFIATRLVCSVCVWECELVGNEKCRLSLSDGRHWYVLRRHWCVLRRNRYVLWRQ